VKKIINNKKAFGFVDSGVKILIAVVIGALVLGGTYTLTKDTVMASAKEKVEELFDYKGETLEEEEPTLFSFRVPQGTFQAEEGMTFGEWTASEYNSSCLSVIKNNYIGRDDGGGAGIKLYYKQDGKTVYVKAGDPIDTSKDYKTEINLPFIPF